VAATAGASAVALVAFVGASVATLAECEFGGASFGAVA
jgi:hypothetical protein